MVGAAGSLRRDFPFPKGNVLDFSSTAAILISVQFHGVPIPIGQDSDFYLPLQESLRRARNYPRNTLTPLMAAGGHEIARLDPAQAGRPVAILFRQVATPNYETRQFLRRCQRLGLTPFLLEYPQDRFCSRNPCKHALLHPHFVEMINRRGAPVHRRYRLADPEQWEGKPLSLVQANEARLADLHSSAFSNVAESLPCRWDASAWFATYPTGAEGYYVDLLSSLTGDVLLMEDFVTDDPDEARFFARVVLPAFHQATQILGHRPNVTRLCDNRRGASPLWYAYPDWLRPAFAPEAAE